MVCPAQEAEGVAAFCLSHPRRGLMALRYPRYLQRGYREEPRQVPIVPAVLPAIDQNMIGARTKPTMTIPVMSRMASIISSFKGDVWGSVDPSSNEA